MLLILQSHPQRSVHARLVLQESRLRLDSETFPNEAAVGIYKGNEVTRISPASTRPQSSHLAKPLLTDSGRNKWNWCARADLHFKKKVQAGLTRQTFPQNLHMRGKAANTTRETGREIQTDRQTEDTQTETKTEYATKSTTGEFSPSSIQAANPLADFIR